MNPKHTVRSALALVATLGACNTDTLAVPPPPAIKDASGDFLPTFVGPRNADLDVTTANVTFDGAEFVLTSTSAGRIGTTPGALFVWGVNRGQGTARFGALAPGVLFDAVVLLRADGTGQVTDLITTPTPTTQPLAAGSVTVSGNMLTARVPAALLPGRGLQPAQFTVNLWPRVGTGNNNQISDFAPDNSNVAVRAIR